MLQTLLVYSVLTALSARQLLETGVKPFGPLVHTPAGEQTAPAEQSHPQVNGQTAGQSDSVKVSDERKEDVSSKQERKKKR